jgi:serine phosphatase RsbU (regulator of sigma subunit)
VQVEAREVSLEPGDLIVFYTDGVTEAHGGPGGFFEAEGLAGALATCAGGSAGSVARNIEVAVLHHQAGSARDDVAVLVVRNPGAPS